MKPEPKPQFSLATIFVVFIGAAIFAYLMAQYGVETIGPWAILALIFLGLYVVGSFLVRGVESAAANDPSSPIKLETFEDNYQASVLVGRLKEAGVHAVAVGGFTSGFQAESPGYVHVVVPQSELEIAKKILKEPAKDLVE